MVTNQGRGRSGEACLDGVLTLNPAVAVAARDAIADGGSKAAPGTFDLSADVVTAIEDGEIAFAVDQQRYAPIRSATASCCSTGARAWASTPRARSPVRSSPP
ncbi:hypothetical protein [Streptosporangium sp. NPDC023615]|uniref:hypothetical protein n=1 Tax=Streptosporangium sp. NPDC023615 TaxID=3154794 RepID=UPI0034167317